MPAALKPKIAALIASLSVPWRRVSCAVTARPVLGLSCAIDGPSISIAGASWRLYPGSARTAECMTIRWSPIQAREGDTSLRVIRTDALSSEPAMPR